MKPGTKSALRWAAWVSGVALLALLLRRIDGRVVLQALSGVGPKILWLFAAYAAGTLVVALPWRMLWPASGRPGWAAAVASRFAASGVNAVLPFLSLGEACRLNWVRRSQWATAMATIVVDRILFCSASALFLFAGAVATLAIPGLPRSFGVAGLAGGLVIVAAVLVAALVSARGRPAGWVLGALRRVGVTGASEDAPGRPHGVDAALRSMLAGPKRPMLVALAVHVGGRILLAAEIYAGLRALGVQAHLSMSFVFAAVPLALSIVGAFIPGQIGVQEGAQAVVAAALGLPPAIGVALVLLSRVRQLVFVPLAYALLAFTPFRPRGEPLTPHPATPSP